MGLTKRKASAIAFAITAVVMAVLVAYTLTQPTEIPQFDHETEGLESVNVTTEFAMGAGDCDFSEDTPASGGMSYSWFGVLDAPQLEEGDDAYVVAVVVSDGERSCRAGVLPGGEATLSLDPGEYRVSVLGSDGSVMDSGTIRVWKSGNATIGPVIDLG